MTLTEVIRWPDHEIVWVAPGAPPGDLDRVFPVEEWWWDKRQAEEES